MDPAPNQRLTRHTIFFHRIIRRAVMAVAVVVLLLGSYLGSYAGAVWLEGQRRISRPTLNSLRETVFAPAHYYADSYFPGAQTYRRCVLYAHFRGLGMPVKWKDCIAP
jgi:hypothetical protein